MYSPTESFECRGQVSRWLLWSYAISQGLAEWMLWGWVAPLWARLGGSLLLMVHAIWFFWRSSGVWGLRHDRQGWQLWRPTTGWCTVRMLPGTLVTPILVILCFRRAGSPRWWSETLCIPRDALSVPQHRRLRVRLRFGRQNYLG